MTSPMLANEADGWTKLHGDPPPTLHHYTTGQGLLGMLQAGRLWATNAHFMNDPKEITYAADIVQRAVREAADRHKAAVDALDPGWMDKLISYGPVLESGMVARSLRTFLQAARYDHVIPHVTQSKVPYRA